jgi:serine/threonine protein kinase
VTVFPCGAAVNESETAAIEHLKRQLQNFEGDDQWVLLSNLAFSVTHQFQSDEIDIIAIGPPGIRVIEVKHWTAGWADANPSAVEQEADKLTNKARKIGTTARRVVSDLPRVDGVFFLTQPASKVKRLSGRLVRGVACYSLNQWKDAIGIDQPRVLSAVQVMAVSQALAPKSAVAMDGSLRRLAGYVNLELQTPREQRFHRVYKGSHPARRDRVILHLYDLSASDDPNAEARAKREADALQRLQLYPWAPRILDSWQDAPGYAGEMYFFTVVDPAAPCVEDRASDETWSISSRLLFARDTVRALADLHQAGGAEEPLVHRNLTPRTILVRHDNSPIFTGFDRTRIPSDVSVASSSPPATDYPTTVAPEIQALGLAAADQRSDVYSLCNCLSGLFSGRDDGMSSGAIEILSAGCAGSPEQRSGLEELDRALSELVGDSIPPPPAPPARFWTEDQTIRFNGRDYRIITRLGSGGVGTTFKVVEVDRATKEDLGTYVAKVAHEGDTGRRVLKAYSLARSHLGRHEGLSPIYESALEWQENQFISLLGWIEGTPLSEFTGVFPLLADEQDEQSAESLAMRFLERMCEALGVLHRNGLIHGDVSPRNMIVSGSSLVLTDYDFVTRLAEVSCAPGTVAYCCSSREQRLPAQPGDDLFSLAASFFHVLFEKEPFRYNGELAKERGLNWDEASRAECPILADILDRATSPAREKRFSSAEEMLEALRQSQRTTATDRSGQEASVVARQVDEPDKTNHAPLTEQRIEWLKSLLQSYPGSHWGNRETRGLDTQFAAQTYVPTPLEDSLLDDIRTSRVRLVILCGNAGDGKTALLQHLAEQLGLGRHSSADRILEGRVPNGPRVRMNLDGSAAWRGKSADQILDEFLAPFQDGSPRDNIVHLLAVNDGRLLEWIEGVEDRLGKETPLTAELYELLQQESVTTESHIRFINLNQRSLVGGITTDRTRIDTTFLERLLDHLLGGARAADIWSVCHSCSAKDRCRVFQAVRVFGPAPIESSVPLDVRRRARLRLFEALQAVHLRGESHITVRELRAALVYVLFGVHFCDDYHIGADEALPFWDRAFSAESLARQGEVLREMARFDPALESHPQIDRYLLSPSSIDGSRAAPHYRGFSLESARRRAFFEWTDEHVKQVAGDAKALGLARGRHLQLFRGLPLQQDQEKLAEITRQLCAGISRLEDLPPQALDRQGVVPLRITPRTPTETAFWVEKPLESFRIEADLPNVGVGIERLHRQASLIYRYRDGKQEVLRLGAELFHLLLELGDGYQLGDVSTDDTFAQLSIFVQRLVREDQRELLAWSPMQDERIYKVAAVLGNEGKEPLQQIQITPITTESPL